MLPVSQYEALLAEVRGLRQQAQHVQELAIPLITNPQEAATSSGLHKNVGHSGTNHASRHSLNRRMDHLVYKTHHSRTTGLVEYESAVNGSTEGETTCSEDELCIPHVAQLSASSDAAGHSSKSSASHHGTWHAESNMWNSEPLHVGVEKDVHSRQMDVTSVMSFASSSGGAPLDRVLNSPDSSRRSSHQLEAKVDMVYSLLAMLGGQEHADMGETLLALSTSPESCLAMRQSGCIPLLVQLVQSDKDCDTRIKASQALQNLINAQPDERIKKREVRIFKLLEQARGYTEALVNNTEYVPENSSLTESEDGDKHPVQTVAHLMKLSFDEGHRHAICQLGGINVIAGLIEMEHNKHGTKSDDTHCILLRRYSCMTLTNLTFGDSGNKALLCSYRDFMRALVLQLQSSSDELRQVTASVLRNLSWRADDSSKAILREVGTVTGLMKAAMLDNRENTLKSILSALWNLSAHSTENKAEICAIEGALGFLVDMLSYKTPSKTLTIIENAGGILRNISSQIAVRDDYREILRKHNCLQVLLDQLKSPSLTIVSNACGTLWNLSAKNNADQETLWQMGAPAMLRSLNHSKHKMIAMGSSAALKNLLSAKPKQAVFPTMDSTARSMELPVLPTLGARRQKALMQELDQSLAETFENIESDSPVKAFSSLNYAEPSTSKDGSIQVMSLKSEAPAKDKASSKESDICDLKFTRQISSSSSCGSKNNDAKAHVSSEFDEKEHCSLDSVSDGDELPRCKVLKEACGGEIKGSVFEDQTIVYQEESTPVHYRSSVRSTTYQKQKQQSTKPGDHQTQKTEYGKNKPQAAMSDDEEDERMLTACISIGMQSSRHDINQQAVSLNTFSRLKKSRTGIPAPKSTKPPNLGLCDSGDGLSVSVDKIKSDAEDHACDTSVVALCNEADLKMGNVQRKDKSSDEEEGVAVSNFAALRITEQTDGVLNRTSEQFISYCSRSQSPSPECPKVPENKPEQSPDKPKQTDPESVEDKSSGFESDCESSKLIDNRMLDPDAMIESLDRFTAELVSQASHLQNKDDKFATSTTDGNTWNDDNDVTFPSMSGSAPQVITFHSEAEDLDKRPESNDFSSINTSTMTESTLIAMEATKMATAINESELANSLNSNDSLELDNVQPPSHLNSLTNSGVDLHDGSGGSRVGGKSKRLPAGFFVRKALSNSLNQASSLESLENHSFTNLDLVGPPSVMAEVLDLEGSMTSIASLPNETPPLSKDQKLKQPTSLLAYDISSLENINPPSLFSQVTDACNSLADVPTEIIGDETEIYEDCNTHVTEATLQTMDDSEFTDANNITPIQSDFGSSSTDSTPKKTKLLNKRLTPKQKRNLTRERYRTYTVAAEMVMKEETEKLSQGGDETLLEDYKTADYISEDMSSSGNDSGCGKLTPKERRRNDRFRFQTQVIDVPVIDVQRQNDAENPPESPPKSVKQKFLHKRKENHDRFKTRTIEESCVSPDILSSSPATASLELDSLLQKEASLVVKHLSDAKSGDDLLECETLSLVSNEDDSENNSGSSINYRTYHKSWGQRNNGIPVIVPEKQITVPEVTQRKIVAEQIVNEELESIEREEENDSEEDVKHVGKPKIVKPGERREMVKEEEEEVKAIRGRRKPLYSKSGVVGSIPRSAKPIKNVTSELVKNVTSTIKSARNQQKQPTARPPSGQPKPTVNQRTQAPKTGSPLRNPKPPEPSKMSPMKRQGTFVKEEAPKSRIPTAGSKSPASRIAKPIPQARNNIVKSASSDRAIKPPTALNRTYMRSPSLDSKERIAGRRAVQSSPSSQSLKTDSKSGAVKRMSAPGVGQRSSSSSSINSGDSASKKQITSKIASLWKRIEQSKKQEPKKDNRIWIEPDSTTAEEVQVRN